MNDAYVPLQQATGLFTRHDPIISACLQTGMRQCHRADGIQEGERASTACQINITFNVLSGLMKHLKYCAYSISPVTPAGSKSISASTPGFGVTSVQQYRCSLWEWVLSTGDNLPMLRTCLDLPLKKGCTIDARNILRNSANPIVVLLDNCNNVQGLL